MRLLNRPRPLGALHSQQVDRLVLAQVLVLQPLGQQVNRPRPLGQLRMRQVRQLHNLLQLRGQPHGQQIETPVNLPRLLGILLG